jgi:ketopantoate reductase
MKVLVYGAGPLGSLFAARLQQGGHDVSILARGQRLAELREHGIVLQDVQTKERSVTLVNVVEALAPDAAYDLVLVIMRKNHALQILPVLAANGHTPNVLFLMNNAAGPGELTEALGRARVLIGFPARATWCTIWQALQRNLGPSTWVKWTGVRPSGRRWWRRSSRMDRDSRPRSGLTWTPGSSTTSRC